VTISGLAPNTVYYFKIHGENDNGQFTDQIYSVRTRKAGPAGTVEIRKINAANSEPLPGACFSIFTDEGSGALGQWVAAGCDEFDAAPKDGKLVLAGVPAGNYVLVEDRAPVGFKLAKKRTFTLANGATKVLTVKDSSGGSAILAFAKDEFNKPIKGMCFDVYRRLSNGAVGEYVAGACDDFDKIDGFAAIRGLSKGKYYLWESYVVEGYQRGALTPFDILNDGSNFEVSIFTYLLKSKKLVVVKAVNSAGSPSWGACYALFADMGSGRLGDILVSSCDGSDGELDGSTYFYGLSSTVKYVFVEYVAPDGQQVGQKKSFTKGPNQRTITFKQVGGGKTLTITNVKGSSTAKLPGACFALFKLVAGQYQLFAFTCDSSDNTNDGVTRVRGLPSGTYRVVETNVPAGHRQPVPIDVTIGSSNKSLTVHTNT
jgi:uncharacterized surface anchored protein